MTGANVPSLKPNFEERNTMKSGTRDETEGKFHQVKGKIKKIDGKVSMNADMEAEGKEETLAGKVQEKSGELEKVLGEVEKSRGMGETKKEAKDSAAPNVGQAISGRILVAEDNKAIKDIVSRFLEFIGFEVALAGNGLEALSLFLKTSFDLVLTDLDMPFMDG
jgi:uncharacterized protein YjbJ (UPF0337 family)